MAAPYQFRLFNTLSRKVEPLVTLDPGKVKLYCCGPTVYHYAHIGNLRAYTMEDVLVRTLRYLGYDVQHVMNITDVGHLVNDADSGEDKMSVAMRRENKKSAEVAAYYTEAFLSDCTALNISRPTITCNATAHITQMIELIQRLEKKGVAYRAGGNVYFDTSKFPSYAELARLKLDEMKAGTRVEVDEGKRNPSDFALWFTKSKFENQELQWDSPWGRGYPGWHIECSAMAMHHLGEKIDIHCGGIDHIPVHHTNEIAQSEGATGHRWVTHWMHVDFLLLDAGKMSKSAGGFLRLSSITERGYSSLAYRLFLLSANYRTQLAFSFEAIEASHQTLKKLTNQVVALKASGPPSTALSSPALALQERFRNALAEDLNTPLALAVMWETLSAGALPPAERLRLLYDFDMVLGLGMESMKQEQVAIPAQVQSLLDARSAARATKNFSESDRLRDEIAALGFVVKDGAQGQVVSRK